MKKKIFILLMLIIPLLLIAIDNRVPMNRGDYDFKYSIRVGDTLFIKTASGDMYFPVTYGTAGYVLTSNGLGKVYWAPDTSEFSADSLIGLKKLTIDSIFIMKDGAKQYFGSDLDCYFEYDNDDTLLRYSGRDIDFNGQRILNEQSFIDLSARGAGYFFDGSNDYINIDDLAAELVDAGNTKGTIVWKGKIHDFTTDFRNLWCFGDADVNEYINLSVNDDDYTFRVTCVISGTTKWAFETTDTFSEDVEYFIVLVQDGTEATLYVNGLPVSVNWLSLSDKTAWFDDATGIDKGRIGCLNYNNYGNDNFLNCTVSYFDAFNLALTQSEIQEIMNHGVPFKYQGASQSIISTYDTTKTSDSADVDLGWNYTFTKGNTDSCLINGTIYTISGSDTDFVATTTLFAAYGDLTNSNLRHTGCIAQYEPSGVGHNQWTDASGNELHGTVSGATPFGQPVNHTETWEYSNLTSSTTITLPEGYYIQDIGYRNQSTDNSILAVGFSAGGEEVMDSLTVSASGIGFATLKSKKATAADDNLYIEVTDSIDVQVIMQRYDN